LLSGVLENTNDAYAIAKIAGIKMCESYNIQYGTNYKCLMPTNTFGPNDDYDDFNSHFFPALIKKVHLLKKKKLKQLTLWGNGQAKREVIFVDDLADACIYFMKKKTKSFLINIGTGKDYTIEKFAKIILKTILPNKKINIRYDISKPNGTPRKILDISLARKYGWYAKSNLQKSILLTYNDYLNKINL
jgi:GDP-L-fucose synthase